MVEIQLTPEESAKRWRAAWQAERAAHQRFRYLVRAAGEGHAARNDPEYLRLLNETVTTEANAVLDGNG